MRVKAKEELTQKVITLMDADANLINCLDALDILDAVQKHYKDMILQNTREAFGLPEPEYTPEVYFDLPF
jgi:hypothetical protein